MTLEQEFEKQWASVCNYVKADMLKSNNRSINYKQVQSMLDNEKKKWFLPGQYNNAWFEKLKRTNQDVAQAFENTLRNIKVEPVNSKKSNIRLLFLETATAGAAVGFGVSRIVMAMMLSSVLWTVGGTVVGLIVGTGISSKKKKDMSDELCSAYEKQLKKSGKMLSQIVSRTN